MGDNEDDESQGSTILGQILQSVKTEGHQPGTEAYDRRVRYLKVIRCREMRGFSSCAPCPAADHCELFVAVKRDSRGL